MTAQHTQHFGEIFVGCAAAAEFARHACLDETRLLQRIDVVGNEAIFVLNVSGGEALAQFTGNLDGIELLDGRDRLYLSHVILPCEVMPPSSQTRGRPLVLHLD